MSDFAVVIGYQFPGEDYKSVILDTIDDVRTDGAARITEQPVIDGDIIGDHMFNEPKTMNITGTLSMNGSNVTVVDGRGSKLANFQELFEKIQEQGIKCDVVKLSTTNDEDVRFLHRHNMAINRLSWVEKINSMNFTLGFREVMTTEVVQYDVDIDDAYLPYITEPDSLSFTDTLIDWEQIDESIVKILLDEKLMQAEFINMLSSFGEATLRSLVPAAVALVLVGVMAALGTNPVGWVLAAVAAAIASAVIFIKGIVSLFKRIFKIGKVYKIRKFVKSNNDKKNKKEINRFGEFIKSVHDRFQSINSLIHVYRVSENKPQEAMISVGDEYYIFTYTWNNVDQKYSLKIENTDISNTASQPNIATAPTNFDQLTNNNYLIKAANNATIYLVYSPVIEEDESQATAKVADENDLRNYLIVVCDFDVEKFQKLVEDIIKDAIFA